MHQPNTGGLSEQDKHLLKTIDHNYLLASRLIGNEPYIYAEFNIKFKSEAPEQSRKLQDLRKDAFQAGKQNVPKGK